MLRTAHHKEAYHRQTLSSHRHKSLLELVALVERREKLALAGIVSSHCLPLVFLLLFPGTFDGCQGFKVFVFDAFNFIVERTQKG